MRLLTHNFLKSNVKGTEHGYPLNIEVTTVRCEEPPSPVDTDFLLKLLPKINYSALQHAVRQIAPFCDPPIGELPEELDMILLNDKNNDNQETNNATVANLHRILFDIYLVEGYLICPGTGRRFPVKDCIPNMILHEDEI